MSASGTRMQATRRSLIDALPNWDDRAKWQEFFDTYSGLIYGVARKSGLTDAEAHDVVQETILGVARNIAKYDPGAGSFKSWMLQLTRWRIVDQIRKRSPADTARGSGGEDQRDTATVDRLPDLSAEESLDSLWDEEWKRSLLAAAVERVKRKVNAKHFQIFDCAVTKQWSPAKVAAELKVNVAQVYLVKHRIAALLKKEVSALEHTQ